MQKEKDNSTKEAKEAKNAWNIYTGKDGITKR